MGKSQAQNCHPQEGTAQGSGNRNGAHAHTARRRLVKLNRHGDRCKLLDQLSLQQEPRQSDVAKKSAVPMDVLGEASVKNADAAMGDTAGPARSSSSAATATSARRGEDHGRRARSHRHRYPQETNKHWANNCHDFRSHENLVEVPIVEGSRAQCHWAARRS